MKWGKYLSMTAVLALAVHASAATVNLTFSGVSPGESESVSFNGGSNVSTTAGAMDFAVGTPNNVPGIITASSITSYCIEGTQSISHGNNVNYTVLGPGQGSFTSVFTNSGLVSAFFNQYYNTVLSATTSSQKNEYNSAFQLAIWELVYDGTSDKPHTGDHNDSRWFTSGDFEIEHSTWGWNAVGPTGSDFSNPEINLAETWLDGFNTSTTGIWQIYQLSNGTKQDQVFAVQGVGAPTPTPLPAALPASLGLIGSLAAVRKLRKKA